MVEFAILITKGRLLPNIITMTEPMPEGNQSKNPNVCRCHHHKVVPAMIILLALDFLLGTLGVFSWQAVNIIWPILVIIAAGTKLFEHNCGCCDQHSRW